MSDVPVTPYKVDLSTVAVFRRARALVSGKYAVFLGVSVIGVVIGGAVSAAILMGTMLSGIYICYRKHEKDEPVELSDLFKGFEHFAESLIATLILMAVTLLATAPFVGALLIGLALLDSPDDAKSALGTSLVVGGSVMTFFVRVILRCLTQFTYPLIVDRKLSAIAAIRTSIRGAWMNLTSVFATEMVTNLSFLLAGACTCFVGIWFLFPFYFAMNWVEYTEIFADGEVESDEGTVFVDEEEEPS